MKYKKHFLSSVIMRVDFVSEENSIKQALISNVRNICIENFPIYEERKVEKQQFVVNNVLDKQKTDTYKETFFEWHFFGNNREKELCIASNCLFIEYKDYINYDDSKQQFINIIKTLIEYYPNIKINRIGLRYINHIDLPSINKTRKDWYDYWKKYISVNLLCGLKIADEDNAITRNMNTLEMNYNDHMLRFQYGIYNQDYPAPNKKNSFIIDTDIYKTGLYETEDVKNAIDEYHRQANEWFEKSISENLRKIMGEIKENA